MYSTLCCAAVQKYPRKDKEDRLADLRIRGSFFSPSLPTTSSLSIGPVTCKLVVRLGSFVGNDYPCDHKQHSAGARSFGRIGIACSAVRPSCVLIRVDAYMSILDRRYHNSIFCIVERFFVDLLGIVQVASSVPKIDQTSDPIASPDRSKVRGTSFRPFGTSYLVISLVLRPAATGF